MNRESTAQLERGGKGREGEEEGAGQPKVCRTETLIVTDTKPRNANVEALSLYNEKLKKKNLQKQPCANNATEDTHATTLTHPKFNK